MKYLYYIPCAIFILLCLCAITSTLGQIILWVGVSILGIMELLDIKIFK